MTVNGTEPTAGFQVRVKFFERGMFDLHFGVAFAADQVMVVLLRNFVDQVTAAHVGGARQPVIGEKLQGAVHGGFCQAGQGRLYAGKDFDRGEMCALVVQDMDDRHALGRHPKSALSQLGGVLVRTAHIILIAKIINNVLYQEDGRATHLTKMEHFVWGFSTVAVKLGPREGMNLRHP